MGYTGWEQQPYNQTGGPSVSTLPFSGSGDPTLQLLGLGGGAFGAGGNDFANLLNLVLNQPTQAQEAYQYGNLSGQMDLQNALYGANADWLNTQAGFDRQNLALEQQGLDLQGRGIDISQGALNRQPAYLTGQYNLANQGFDAAERQANSAYDTQLRNLNSGYTSRGAWGARFQGLKQNDLAKQLYESILGVGRERQGTTLSYNENMAKIGDEQARLDLSRDQLKLMSDKLGISGQEIEARLSHSLQQLGLNTALSTQDLLGELAKIQSGQFSPISNIMSALFQYAGLNPSVIGAGGSVAVGPGGPVGSTGGSGAVGPYGAIGG